MRDIVSISFDKVHWRIARYTPVFRNGQWVYTKRDCRAKPRKWCRIAEWDAKAYAAKHGIPFVNGVMHGAKVTNSHPDYAQH